MKLLQDPNSLLMKHIQKLMDIQVENDENSNSHANKIGTLKDYEIYSKRGDKIGKLKDCEIGMEQEILSYPNQRIPTIYSKVKKHLSEMLSNGDEEDDILRRQTPKTLGWILSLPEFVSTIGRPWRIEVLHIRDFLLVGSLKR